MGWEVYSNVCCGCQISILLCWMSLLTFFLIFIAFQVWEFSSRMQSPVFSLNGADVDVFWAPTARRWSCPVIKIPPPCLGFEMPWKKGLEWSTHVKGEISKIDFLIWILRRNHGNKGGRLSFEIFFLRCKQLWVGKCTQMFVVGARFVSFCVGWVC